MRRKIKLGDEVKDPITGFQGVAVARTSWLQGCERIMIQPRGLTDEGTPIKADWFDEPQLERVKGPRTEGTGEGGGPRPDPTMRANPSRR